MVGDIVPACALYTFTHFPAEFTGQAEHHQMDVGQTDRRKQHTGRGLPVMSFNFLPENASCTDIRH